MVQYQCKQKRTSKLVQERRYKMIYGYARISRKTQSIDRQIRNIKAVYPDACIAAEAFTGTKIQGRKALDKILKAVKPGDTIVFDSASRMSRNADEAVDLYMDLYAKGVHLKFIKEPHIDSDVYSQAISRTIPETGNKYADCFIEAANKLFKILAEDQIRIVFEQAQKEVDDLHQRTKEGIQTAKLNGKQIGRREGTTLETKKGREAKEKIRKYSKDFDGSLNDPEVIQLTGISRNSFYKYKKEMREELAGV